MSFLIEKRRNELVAQSKQSVKGLERFRKRFKSKVASSNREYNNIDMDKFFKMDILDIVINVRGETDDYKIKISFGGTLDYLKQETRDNEIDLRTVVRSIVKAFNQQDTFISCNCPDFYYRFGFQATINKYINGEPQLIPANKTNPDNDLGSACKHSLLVLSNTSWVIKVASVINNYINYMKTHRENMYASIIYPAIYGKKYEKPVQQDLFDTDKLETETDVIDDANVYARTKTQFKPGNPTRIQPRQTVRDQISMADLEEIDDEQ